MFIKYRFLKKFYLYVSFIFYFKLKLEYKERSVIILLIRDGKYESNLYLENFSVESWDFNSWLFF